MCRYLETLDHDFDDELEGHFLNDVYSLEVSHKFLRALASDDTHLPCGVTLQSFARFCA